MVNITIENTNVCSYIIEALVPYCRYHWWMDGGMVVSVKEQNFFKYSAEVQGLEVHEKNLGKNAGGETPAL